MRASEAVESAYRAIRDAIISGEFPPGHTLVESTLAERCRVSRTPVREALSRLTQDGLVQRTARGHVVRERTPDEILDLYEARIVLEGSVARVAAERRTKMDLVRLTRAIQRAESLEDPSPSAMVGSNAEFHEAIWHAAHNEALSDLLIRLSLHVARYTGTTLTYPGRWRQALDEHRVIFEAIEAQEPAEASQAATEHFAVARDIRIALWADTDDEHGGSSR